MVRRASNGEPPDRKRKRQCRVISTVIGPFPVRRRDMPLSVCSWGRNKFESFTNNEWLIRYVRWKDERPSLRSSSTWMSQSTRSRVNIGKRVLELWSAKKKETAAIGTIADTIWVNFNLRFSSSSSSSSWGNDMVKNVKKLNSNRAMICEQWKFGNVSKMWSKKCDIRKWSDSTNWWLRMEAKFTK